MNPISQPAPAPAPAPAPIPAPKLDRKPSGVDSLAIAALAGFVVVGGLLVFGFARALVPAAEAQLGAACRPLAPKPVGVVAPELELEDLDGNPVSLADYRGKFLVVNFWATWCEPCTREWPDLAILGERLSERDDVVVLAISVDKQLADIPPYMARMGLSDTDVTILHDTTSVAHESFGSEKIPDTYFVNREGVIESVFVNIRQWGRAPAYRCVDASVDD
ncbi:TlpA family protein disulfide reductase [Nannocystaceae bacterium ST9]